MAPWIPQGLGNAYQWIERGVGLGLKVSSTPVIGSAMVFGPGYAGSGGYGHVGIVTGIGANGYPIIQEMNANRDGGGHGKYDTYQTDAYDDGMSLGFLLPPGVADPSPLTSTQLNRALAAGTSKTSGAFGPLFEALGGPVTGVIANANSANPIDLNPVDALTGVWKTVYNAVLKGGEVLLGAIVVIVGLYFVAKSAGASVPGAGIIQKLPGVAGMAAKMA